MDQAWENAIFHLIMRASCKSWTDNYIFTIIFSVHLFFSFFLPSRFHLLKATAKILPSPAHKPLLTAILLGKDQSKRMISLWKMLRCTNSSWAHTTSFLFGKTNGCRSMRPKSRRFRSVIGFLNFQDIFRLKRSTLISASFVFTLRVLGLFLFKSIQDLKHFSLHYFGIYNKRNHFFMLYKFTFVPSCFGVLEC